MRLPLIFALPVLACLAGTPVLGQTAEPVAVARGGAVALSVDQRDAALAAIIAQIERRYVFPDRVAAIRDRLREGLTSGRYAVADATVFAERVSVDLRESSRDGHMYLVNNPAQYAAAGPANEEGDDSPELQAIWATAERRANGGLSDMHILPGNVRYLRITQFHWVNDRTGFAYDGAMRFLRDGDAVIIDLRGNGGGDRAAVRYLLSHFLPADTLEMTFKEAGVDDVQSRTLDNLPAGRLLGKPLFVLTDRGVGSAAEAFAYGVQQFRLGTVVGAKTAGAANNNDFVAIAPTFMLSLSYGKPVHPVSGSNWEGVGVSPDVAVDPDVAPEAATSLALDSLLSQEDAAASDRAAWEWARTGVNARLSPVEISTQTLAGFEGTYGGRAIELVGPTLVWRLADGRSRRLTPMNREGLFEVEDANDRFRFQLDGKTLMVHRLDSPAPSEFPRD